MEAVFYLFFEERSQVVPRYYINEWERDPHKWQHHKYHRVRQRHRGKWSRGGK